MPALAENLEGDLTIFELFAANLQYLRSCERVPLAQDINTCKQLPLYI
jgi:hypothetical protein